MFLRSIALTIVPVNESIARAADTIDAVVVAIGDMSDRSIILTGDVGDLRALSLVRRRSHVVSLER
jgi:hypothetical protein